MTLSYLTSPTLLSPLLEYVESLHLPQSCLQSLFFEPPRHTGLLDCSGHLTQCLARSCLQLCGPVGLSSSVPSSINTKAAGAQLHGPRGTAVSTKPDARTSPVLGPERGSIPFQIMMRRIYVVRSVPHRTPHSTVEATPGDPLSPDQRQLRKQEYLLF